MMDHNDQNERHLKAFKMLKMNLLLRDAERHADGRRLTKAFGAWKSRKEAQDTESQVGLFNVTLVAFSLLIYLVMNNSFNIVSI